MNLACDPFVLAAAKSGLHDLVVLLRKRLTHLLATVKGPPRPVGHDPGSDVADRMELDPFRMERAGEFDKRHDFVEVLPHDHEHWDDLHLRSISSQLGKAAQVLGDSVEMVAAPDTEIGG